MGVGWETRLQQFIRNNLGLRSDIVTIVDLCVHLCIRHVQKCHFQTMKFKSWSEIKIRFCCRRNDGHREMAQACLSDQNSRGNHRHVEFHCKQCRRYRNASQKCVVMMFCI